MGTTPNVGLMAQKAEEYGSHDKTFEIAAAGHGPRRRRRRRHAARARRSRPATSGACARRRTRAIQDWVRLAVARARATGAPAVFWLDETRPHDARAAGEGPARARRARHRRPADRDPARGRGHALHARARPARRGHDLRDRQRPARLPHRPLPDPRARHEREDALDRAAHGGRRPVRDRRRRLGAQARPAVRAREPPALGLARRVPGAGRRARACWPSKTGNPRARLLGRGARPRDRHAARAGPVAVAQGGRARQPRQPLLPRAATGRRSSPPRRRTRSSRRASRRSARAAGRGGGDDRRRAGGRAGRARRPRRLLPPGPGEGRRRRCARARR